MSCGIYKFTNKLNRKNYIGQSINIEGRYKAHKRNNKSNFEKAIKKYGIENFDFTIIMECPKENLNYWEKFYVKYYCSNNPDYGYNKTTGGNGSGSAWNSGIKMNAEQKKNMGCPKGTNPWNKGIKTGKPSWNNGLTKETDERVARNAINTSKGCKGREGLKGEKNGMYGKPSPFKGKNHTEEAKNKNRLSHLGKTRCYREDGTFYMVRK